MIKRVVLILLTAALVFPVRLNAQDPEQHIGKPQEDSLIVKKSDKIDSVQFGADVIGMRDNDFAGIDTIPAPKKYKSRHMLGVKYSYDICNVSSNPSIGEKLYFSPVNVSLLYTYYHDLWDYLDIFGLQMGVKYGREGYNSEYGGWGESVQMLQFPLGTQLHINFWKMRLLINLGCYYGYKLSTSKPEGFDENDIRHDYGAYGGAGVGMVFGAFEFHLEANYQFSLCSMYHVNKYSELYWLTAYPRNLCISAGIFVNLW